MLILLAGRVKPFIVDFLANSFWHGAVEGTLDEL
jgi:hypothetical protein